MQLQRPIVLTVFRAAPGHPDDEKCRRASATTRGFIMEYGTKAWMGSFIDHHPGERVIVIHEPTNKPKHRYSCELLAPEDLQAMITPAPQASKVDIDAKRLELGIESRISDPNLDDKWDYLVHTICGGNELRALDETAISGYSNKRAFISDAVKGFKRHRGIVDD